MKYNYFSFLALTIFVLLSTYLGSNIVFDYYTYEKHMSTSLYLLRFDTLTILIGMFLIIITAIIAWVLNFHKHTLDETTQSILLDPKYTESQWTLDNAVNYVTSDVSKGAFSDLKTEFNDIINNELLNKSTKLDKCFFLLNKNIDAFAGVYYHLHDIKNVKQLVWTSQYMIVAPEHPVSFKIGEGFIGEVALQKEYKKLQGIPTEKINFTSALGESKPACILLLPLIDNQQVIGVFEYAFFDTVSEQKIQKIQIAIMSFQYVIKKVFLQHPQTVVSNE